MSKLEAYNRAVSNELGATIIDGVMSDRATDRHARNRLRRAVATGHLDLERGIAGRHHHAGGGRLAAALSRVRSVATGGRFATEVAT